MCDIYHSPEILETHRRAVEYMVCPVHNRTTRGLFEQHQPKTETKLDVSVFYVQE